MAAARLDDTLYCWAVMLAVELDCTLYCWDGMLAIKKVCIAKCKTRCQNEFYSTILGRRAVLPVLDGMLDAGLDGMLYCCA